MRVYQPYYGIPFMIELFFIITKFIIKLTKKTVYASSKTKNKRLKVCNFILPSPFSPKPVSQGEESKQRKYFTLWRSIEPGILGTVKCINHLPTWQYAFKHSKAEFLVFRKMFLHHKTVAS